MFTLLVFVSAIYATFLTLFAFFQGLTDILLKTKRKIVMLPHVLLSTTLWTVFYCLQIGLIGG